MGDQFPQGAIIEILERRVAPGQPGVGDDVIVPTEVRINGQPLLVPDGYPVTVHEMTIGNLGHDCAMVTLTLIAKRIIVEHREPDAEDGATGV